MTKNKQKITLAVTGASGSIYAQQLLRHLGPLKEQLELGLIFSDNAKLVWREELGNTEYENLPFTTYQKGDFMAPMASGSAGYKDMIVCPCSMGTLARIATGQSNDLVTRAADVVLKERGRLILMVRESPYNKIHLQNMLAIQEAGGIILPCSPSFYSKPQNFEQLADTVVHRAMDLLGLPVDTFRWACE